MFYLYIFFLKIYIMSILLGKDNNNNYRYLSVDNEGILWDKLRYRRSLGQCFSTVYDISLTTSTTKAILSIFNTSSTDNIYIYSINVKIVSAATSGMSTCNIYKLTTNPNPISPTIIYGSNLKLGESDSTVSNIKSDISSSDYTTNGLLYTQMLQATLSGTDVENAFILNLYDEMIELQQNTGILIEIDNQTNVTIKGVANVKFMEINNNEIL